MAMRASKAKRGQGAAWLLLLSLLVCAGCNLQAPQSTEERFAGPPVIHIAAPLPEQIFRAGASVIVQARVDNAGPDLARVAVLLDEAVLGEELLPNESGAASLPLTISWPTSLAGRYTLSVLAERSDGSGDRQDLSIEVVAAEASQPQPAPSITSQPAASQPDPPRREGVNLLVSAVELQPAQPACGEAISVRATIRNDGSQDAQTSPWVAAQALLLSDQSVIAENADTTYLPKLSASQEATLEIALIINAHPGQAQRIRVSVDAGNHILESDEDDNQGQSAAFTLSQGNCA